MQRGAGAEDLFFRRQRDLQPLRHKIRHIELHAADRISLRIDIGRNLPAAMGGGFTDCHRPIGRTSLQCRAGKRGAGGFHAVRAARHQGQRRIGGGAKTVAQHSDRAHGFAGAVNPAIGIEIGIDGSGCGPATNAAVGQIEHRAAQIEEGEILLVAIGHHGHGFVPTLAAKKPGGEIGAADIIGHRIGEHIVVARDERKLHAGNRLGTGIGAGENGKAAAALKGGEPDIGIDHPLRGDGLIILIILLFRRIAGDEDIGAGLAILQHLIDRDQRDHGFVPGAGDIHAAGPHGGALIVGDLLLVPAIKRGLVQHPAFEL